MNRKIILFLIGLTFSVASQFVISINGIDFTENDNKWHHTILTKSMYEEALKLSMSVIIEVHTVDEAKKALNFKEALIGINNRNLKSLKTDLNATYDIYDVLQSHSEPLISESGIKTKDELLSLRDKTKIKTFLIGESLLKNLDNNSIFSVL